MASVVKTYIHGPSHHLAHSSASYHCSSPQWIHSKFSRNAVFSLYILVPVRLMNTLSLFKTSDGSPAGRERSSYAGLRVSTNSYLLLTKESLLSTFALHCLCLKSFCLLCFLELYPAPKSQSVSIPPSRSFFFVSLELPSPLNRNHGNRIQSRKWLTELNQVIFFQKLHRTVSHFQQLLHE